MKKIAVVGLGSIGKSIVLALADNGCEVTAVTRRNEQGFAGLCQFIGNEVNKKRTKHNLQEIQSNINWVGSPTNLSKETELVIEAIQENLSEKQQLFLQISKILPDTILSSTTSSLSINEIATAVDKPERFVGLHFFNPAHIMTLVEVIPDKWTSTDTKKASCLFLQNIGKTAILTEDQAGFIVNRLLFSLINESVNVLSEGKVPAKDIDLAMQLGAKHPLGPLHLADMIGLDVCLSILDNLYTKEKKPQYKPHPLLIKMVKNNQLGRKTGKGFFEYSTST